MERGEGWEESENWDCPSSDATDSTGPTVWGPDLIFQSELLSSQGPSFSSMLKKKSVLNQSEENSNRQRNKPYITRITLFKLIEYNNNKIRA